MAKVKITTCRTGYRDASTSLCPDKRPTGPVTLEEMESTNELMYFRDGKLEESKIQRGEKLALAAAAATEKSLSGRKGADRW